MPYIESFLIYLLIIISIFLIIIIPIIFIVWYMSHFEFFNRRKIFQFIFLKKFKFKKNQEVKKEEFSKLLKVILKSNAIVFATIIYFSMSGYFFAKQSYIYYGKDRVYPQAKAYAIVGNTVYLIHSFLFSFPKINIHENDLDKKLMQVQDFILNSMYEYIPKSDAERDYWKYKFKYQSIVTQRYAPVPLKDRNSPDRFMTTEMETAEYSPFLLTMMDEMHRISKSLFNTDMKDKEFKKGIAYLPIAHMSYYLTKKFNHYSTLEGMGKSYIKKNRLMYKNKALYARYVRYINLLILLQQKTDTNIAVKKVFEKAPVNQAFLFTSLIEGFDTIMIYNTIHNIYPCTSKELKEYLRYHRKFYNWIESKNSSYQTLSRRAKKNVHFLFNMVGGDQSHFIIAKYVCDITIDYYIEDEKRLLRTGGGDKKLKRFIISGLPKEKWEYKKILEMKEKIKKGQQTPSFVKAESF